MATITIHAATNDTRDNKSQSQSQHRRRNKKRRTLSTLTSTFIVAVIVIVTTTTMMMAAIITNNINKVALPQIIRNSSSSRSRSSRSRVVLPSTAAAAGGTSFFFGVVSAFHLPVFSSSSQLQSQLQSPSQRIRSTCTSTMAKAMLMTTRTRRTRSPTITTFLRSSSSSTSSSSSSTTDPILTISNSTMSTMSTSVTSSSSSTPSTTIPPNKRAVLLNKYLDLVIAVIPQTQSPQSSSSMTPLDDIGSSSSNSTVVSIDIMDSALRSLLDPSNGYNIKYGRPAVRAYRSFIYPKQQTQDTEHEQLPEQLDSIQLEAIAKRTANQIDFLIKRQTSQQLEAIYNHDSTTTSSSTSDSSATEYKNTQTKIFPITVVLDNIRGAFNVGSIFRTAEACGVYKVITCGITPHPNGSGQEKVFKSSLGAEQLVQTQHYTTTYAALDDIKNKKKNNNDDNLPLPPLVIALETTNISKLYTDIDYRPYYNENKDDDNDNEDDNNDNDHQQQQRAAAVVGAAVVGAGSSRGIVIILGNEVTGVDAELLSPLLLQHQLDNDDDKNDNGKDGSDDDDKVKADASSSSSLVDLIIELPTYGCKNSLNVAAVAPVILYEILRQWNDIE